MDAREVIQKAVYDCGLFKVQTYSDAVMQALSTAGFTIMSKEDVEAVRDKALEEAARAIQCDCCDVCGESPGYPKCAGEQAAAIRSLKSSDTASAKDQAKEAADAALRAARGHRHAD